jgi:hypothetical protein
MVGWRVNYELQNDSEETDRDLIEVLPRTGIQGPSKHFSHDSRYQEWDSNLVHGEHKS